LTTADASVTRVSVHDYVTDPALPQKDGVNLAHENIVTLLKAHDDPALQVDFHELNRLLGDESHARDVLAGVDVVVSNVGPHAHYYFELRERLGLDFRIVRDVRTAIWSSYLLQEWLCQPLLRDQDVLLVGSHYTRGVYEKMFPHLRNRATVLCYPLAVCFPPPPRAARPPRQDGSPFCLGYVGRLSEDKNFPDVVELLIRLNRARPGGFRLIACGDLHSDSCRPETIQALLHDQLGPGDHFEYLPPRNNQDVWALYERFDAKVFSSTSNLETLGRVLVEASHAGVPVIAGRHAAAPELVPTASLCGVDYLTGRDFSAHFDHRLGHVRVDDMVSVVLGGDLPASDCHLEYLGHPEKFLKLLRTPPGQLPPAEALRLQPSQAEFVSRLRVKMPAPLLVNQAMDVIARLRPLFLDLQEKGLAARQGVLALLMERSRHADRTARFVTRSEATRCDFTDVGGIDIELCHIAGFYPSFSLDREAPVPSVCQTATAD